MGEIDIWPPEVHGMGDASREVAATSLTKARKATKETVDDHGAIGLHRFRTRKKLGQLVEKLLVNAADDVVAIHAVGDKLHASAYAVESGDVDSADVFGKVKGT